MSKIFGYVLLGGLIGSVLLSIGLILWVWTQSTNSPQDVVNTTPVPTKKAEIQSPEKLGIRLVDVRQEAGLSSADFTGYNISAGLESLAIACV